MTPSEAAAAEAARLGLQNWLPYDAPRVRHLLTRMRTMIAEMEAQGLTPGRFRASPDITRQEIREGDEVPVIIFGIRCDEDLTLPPESLILEPA